MVNKDSEEDNAEYEARELDHSKISDSQKDGNNEDTESDKEVEEVEQKQNKRDLDNEEGTIEVVFDSGGVKVSKKINLIQLVLKDEELREEEDEDEGIDTGVEEENVITAEEGDGR